MATRLIEIVTAEGVAAGATVVIPHHLNVDGNAKIPDWISRDNMGFAGVAADDDSVTVRNDTGDAADIELYLFYDHTIQRVYGDSSVLQLTPAPFWISGAGSTSTSSGIVDTFVYRPGGAAAGPSVFASFSDLYAAMVAARTAAGGNIPITLMYDASLGAVTVPAGTYDFTNVLQVGRSGTQTAVAYADGTVFTGARQWRDLVITNLNTTTPPITDAVDGDAFMLVRTVLSSTTAGTIPVIRFGTAGGTFTVWLCASALGGGSIRGGTQTGRVLGTTGAAAKLVQLVLDAASRLPVPDALVGGGGSTLSIEAPAGVQIPVVTSWTTATGSPILDSPAGLRPNPYLGSPSTTAVTAAMGQWIRLDATTAAANITQPLPAIGAATSNLRGAGVMLGVTNAPNGGTPSGGFAVILTPDGSDTIEGLTSYTLMPGSSVLLVSNGVSQWSVLSVRDGAVPQVLKTPGWDGAVGSTGLSTNAARVELLGYAWRRFLAGETLTFGWRVVSAATGVTWAEVGIAYSETFVTGTAPAIYAVGAADVATPIAAAAPGNYFTTVTLSQAIPQGAPIWALFAKASTGSPSIASGPADVQGSAMAMTITTAGWRPSLQIGVGITPGTIDTATAPLRAIVTPSVGF